MNWFMLILLASLISAYYVGARSFLDDIEDRDHRQWARQALDKFYRDEDYVLKEILDVQEVNFPDQLSGDYYYSMSFKVQRSYCHGQFTMDCAPIPCKVKLMEHIGDLVHRIEIYSCKCQDRFAKHGNYSV